MLAASEYTGYLFSNYQLPFSDPLQAGLAGEHVSAAGYDPATFGLAVHQMGAGTSAASEPTAQPAGLTGDIGKGIADSLLGALAKAGVTVAGVVIGGAVVALGLYAFARGN